MKKGSTLVIVMLMSFILGVVMTSMVFMTSNLARFNRRIYDRVAAAAISEAGIAETLSQMGQHGMYNVTNPVYAKFANGDFLVYQTLYTNGHILLRSKGSYRTAQITTALEVLGDLWSLYDKILGVDGTIISGGNIVLDSSAINIKGTIHANGNIINLQGNPNIDGSITSSGKILGDINCTGSQQDNVMPVTVPTYKPFTAWENLAKTNGIYYPNGLILNGSDLYPSNGIIYVNGNVVIQNNSSVHGTIIASGTITIENNFKQTSFNTNWPALLAGVDINLYNRNDLYGVFFACGNITSVNKKNITGCLIAGGNVSIKNNFDMEPLYHDVQWSPLDTNQNPSIPIVGGWLE